MATYLFEGGVFLPYDGESGDELSWAESLLQRGYIGNERVWGQYPDVYVKVYEAPSKSSVEFPFIAVLNLVSSPHHILLRDLNGLVQLLHAVMPLFEKHSRPDAEVGDALSGTQGAD